MHYVSDIHLNHFVFNKFNEIYPEPESEATKYIKDLAKKMTDSSGKSEFY
jgi:hypothetical protein